MSVVGLFPEFRNGHLGGIQASASTAWTAVSGRGEVTLLCYEKQTSASARSTQTDGHSRAIAIFSVLKQSKQPDILLIWQIGMLKLLPFFRKRPKRVILFLHGIEAWKKQDWLTQQLLKRVNLFLSNSDYTWDRFVSYNPSLEAFDHETVWLGIDSACSTAASAPDRKPKALMLSRLSQSEDYKGHRELISAWPLVLKHIPEAELLIAGDGDLRAELERMPEMNAVTASVKFLGRVSEEKKQELLGQSRCLVMPSRGEGFGLVYLEAMRLGRPCLVSTLDAGREVVNPPEAGLAADPDDQRQLADAVCRLLTNGPEWDQWSERAKRRYEENYTAKQFQQRLLTALFTNNSITPGRKDLSILNT